MNLILDSAAPGVFESGIEFDQALVYGIVALISIVVAVVLVILINKKKSK